MGEERDRLIRRCGGVPVSDERLSYAELMRRYMAYYVHESRLPPEIETIRKAKDGK